MGTLKCGVSFFSVQFQFPFRQHGLTTDIYAFTAMSAQKKKSPVWKYFLEPNNNNKAKCKICEVEINYVGGSTSSLLKHLKTVHKNVTAISEETPSTSGLGRFGVTVGKVCNQTKTKEINKLLCDIVTENSLPFAFVESKSVRKLLTYTEPNYKCISSEHAKHIINLQADTLKQTIKSDLEKCKALSLTIDCWTSINNDSFMAVTASFVDEKWQLQTPVLATHNLTERHTADYLANELENIIEEWGIRDTVVSIVHDNASNVKGVAKTIKESWIDIGCAAHTLQICINHAMGTNKVTNNFISRTVNAASRLVGHFHHSGLATQELLKRQETMAQGSQPLKLIQYGRTRWNSIHDMFERLLALRWPVTAVLGDKNVVKQATAKTLDLKTEMWDLIENIIPLLKRLKIANTLLCADNNVSISCVLPVTDMLIKHHLVESEDDELVLKKFKSDLKTMLQERFFTPSDVFIVMAMASALDPRYKKLEFLNEDQRKEVYEKIAAEVIKLKENPNETVEVEAEEKNNSAMGNVLSEEEAFFKSVELKTEAGVVSLASENEKTELERFLDLPCADLKCNPLLWWSINERQFIYLSKLVKTLFCTPATSTASERHFSVAGRTVTKIRNRLRAEVTETLLFVNRNKVY